MNRTVLAFVVAGVLAFGIGALDAAVEIDPWIAFVAAVAVMLVASLVDRDGFYGPRER